MYRSFSAGVSLARKLKPRLQAAVVEAPKDPPGMPVSPAPYSLRPGRATEMTLHKTMLSAEPAHAPAQRPPPARQAPARARLPSPPPTGGPHRDGRVFTAT
jgi:hypothetical protein